MTIETHVSLAPYTTFKIGGKADFFCRVSSGNELQEALRFAHEKQIPFFVLGGGSNVLIADEGYGGLVIKNEIKGFVEQERGDTVLITVGAGEWWDDVVSKTVTLGLWGLENLSLIPGTVGASPVQNIGAYGVEVMNVIDSVSAVHGVTGEEKIFTNAECGFAYRTSIFKKTEYKKYIITSVTFALSRIPRPILSYKDVKEFFATKNIVAPSQREIREAVIAIRTQKFPDLSAVGTAGSFWKNPIISDELYGSLGTQHRDMPAFPSPVGVKVSLAWILDHVCHLKGYALGRVHLFNKQPLVVVAEQGSSALDVNRLADFVVQDVKEKTGIDIEREVEWVS